MKKNFIKIMLILTIGVLTFGTSKAWIWLIPENGDLLNMVKWNELVSLLNTKIDQTNITWTGVVSVTSSWTWLVIWLNSSTSSPIPEIVNMSQRRILQNQTTDITITGDDFVPNSTVTIPGFPGTINSVTVKSQREIIVNVSSTSASGIYDIIVSNNGVLNTLWSGNWENLISVSNTINIAWDDVSGRGYADGNYAVSCNGYINSGGVYEYIWDTGDGFYNIKPDWNPAFKVYCDMTNNWGGWTRIDFANDLTHQAQFTETVDAAKWLSNDFDLNLSDTQINAIRSVSTQWKQLYTWTCEWVIHHLYQTNDYSYAFWFRFQDWFETAFGQQSYPNTNIVVSNDNCYINNNTYTSTDFTITDIRVPVINVYTRDNSASEKFGSPLTSNPAWLK